jgi:hypothetical protein
LALDFIGRGDTLDPRITFSRTTTGTRFNSAGVLESVAIDGPRFDYDPVTLAARGLLIEEQRTNSIRNNTGVGAVAGTPGTLPTNWTAPATLSGLNREIVGFGTQLGIAYIDIRYSGTTTSTASTVIHPESTTSVVAATGQSWTASALLAVVGGSTSGLLGVIQRVTGRSVVGGLLENTDTSVTLTSTMVRFAASRTMADVLTERVTSDIVLVYPLSAAIDITLRIGLPQLELGAFATSVIPTTTAAVTRTADVASMTGTNFSDWYNASEGTAYVEAAALATAYNASTLTFSDGTNNNRIVIRGMTTGSQSASIGVANTATQWSSVFGSQTAAATKWALGYSVNDIASTRNAATPLTDAGALIPVVNQLRIGADGDGTLTYNGHIRRIAYYPRRLSNDQLRGITV